MLNEQSFSLDPITQGADTGAFQAQQSFSLQKDEPLYGLGILQDGKLNRRGTHRLMIQSNQEDYQNVVQSINGYALFWDNYSPTIFHDDEQSTSFQSQVADGIDYYFLLGDDTDGCIAQLRQLTGQVPMPPL